MSGRSGRGPTPAGRSPARTGLVPIGLAAALLAGCVTDRPVETAAARCSSAPGEALILPGEHAVFVPAGPEDRSVTTAHVTGTDPRGMVTVESDRGPTEVWVVDTSHYHYGARVEVTMAVRAVRVEAGPESPALPGAPPAEWSEPGDHAAVTGRILGRDPRGTITVDSPRGAIRVWATVQPGRYCVQSWVEVRTRVRPAS